MGMMLGTVAMKVQGKKYFKSRLVPALILVTFSLLPIPLLPRNRLTSVTLKIIRHPLKETESSLASIGYELDNATLPFSRVVVDISM